MARMLTDLATAARSSGLPVTEVAGWQTRGHGGFAAVRGVMAHHTAGPASGNYPSLGTVRDGRAGLAGPLANLGIARDGSVLVIAAGVAWHAGKGSGFGLPANGANAYMLGIEAESTGSVAGDWTAAQIDAYPRLVAALARHYGFGVGMIVGHAEWAPGRKVDPRGFPGGMAGIRATAAAILGGATPVSNPVAAAPASPVVHAIAVDGRWGAETTRALQAVLGTPVDGVLSGQYRTATTLALYSGVEFSPRKGGSTAIRALQARLGVAQDGWLGPDTVRALQRHLGTPVDGVISRPDSTMVRALQTRLRAGKV